jgi:aspartate/methionine/tyrosine aminotransferase
MASWRVGYVVFPAGLAQAMSKVQDTNLICAPVISQLLAIEALKLGQDWIRPKIKALATVRNDVYKALEAVGDLIEFPRTAGAFYVLMRLPPLTASEAPMDFVQYMAREHKVVTIPGFAFGLTDQTKGNYQRLSYGALDAASVNEGVSRFIAAVNHWYKR